MGPHTALIIVSHLALVNCQDQCSSQACEGFPLVGGHCALFTVAFEHLSKDDGVCTRDFTCSEAVRKKRQLPPFGTPPPFGTLPPGLTFPPDCLCCKNCEDLSCSVALPGYSCVDERIAKESKTWDLQRCETGRCKPLPGQGPCLCCPAITTTTSTTTTTTTSTTMKPTTTTPPPYCSKSTCCRATFLMGGACTMANLSKPIKKKWCSKAKMCTNSLGVFDKKCTCCRHCKESKQCRQKKGRCVDPATVNWAYWNFDFCYARNAKCIKMNSKLKCLCCGWRNPNKPQLGKGQNVQPPIA